MRIFVNASNMHVGGGNVLLVDFLGAASTLKNIEFIVFVDERFQIPLEAGGNIIFKKIFKALRWRVSPLIEKQTTKNDIVIYLTNIPPMKKHKCKTILVQSNRFLIDYFSLEGFSLKTKIRITFERLLFWQNNKNADYIIVQSESMSTILKKKGINETKIKVFAYKNKEKVNNKKDLSANYEKPKNRFLYIASDEPHKNHKNLIEAWCLLSKNNIFPKLTITININTNLHQFILNKISYYKLDVEIIPNMKRKDILNLYNRSTALIFPSFFESYGLPMVEAVQHGIPVIAAELDYVRDIIDPVETFDPNSPKSIFRSIKRFLEIDEKKTVIYSPLDFIESMMSL